MSSYKPGDTYWGEFTTQRFDTGAATDADSTPTATMIHNGSDDGSVTLTVSHVDTGRYKVTGTISSGYAAGDKVQVLVAAAVNSVSGKTVIDSFVLDSKRVGDLNDLSASSAAGAILANTSHKLSTDSAGGVTLGSCESGAIAAAAFASGVLPANFAALAITSGGAVTAGTVSDKTGYSLAQAFPTNFASLAIDTSGRVTVGGYASGLAPPSTSAIAAAVLVNPAHLLATDSGGAVAANNLPSDYQQRGVAVTLPANPPSGFLASASFGTAPGWYTAPANSDVAAIKTQTDQLAFSGGAIVAALGSGGITSSTFAAGAISAATVSSAAAQAIADALLDRSSAVDGRTPRQVLEIAGAVLAGQVSGAGTGTEVFLGLDGATTRVTVTVDTSGNRTQVVYS